MESCYSFILYKQYEVDFEEVEFSNNLWQINIKEFYFYLGRNRVKGLGKYQYLFFVKSSIDRKEFIKNFKLFYI